MNPEHTSENIFTHNQTCMQVFISMNETLDMLEKICFRGNPVKAQLHSKNSIRE